MPVDMVVIIYLTWCPLLRKQRNLDRIEKWVYVNLMQFNKARCKVLHLACSSHQYRYRPGDEGIENSHVADFETLVDENHV